MKIYCFFFFILDDWKEKSDNELNFNFVLKGVLLWENVTILIAIVKTVTVVIIALAVMIVTKVAIAVNNKFVGLI